MRKLLKNPDEVLKIIGCVNLSLFFSFLGTAVGMAFSGEKKVLKFLACIFVSIMSGLLFAISAVTLWERKKLKEEQ